MTQLAILLHASSHGTSLLMIIIGIVVAGLVLYCINKFVPMEGKIKIILNIVVILTLVVWLLREFGVWAYLARMHI